MRHFVLLLCIALIFSCCRKNISQNQIAGTSGSEYFPNTIGDHWKYKYVDSLNNNVISFVDVDIVGIKTLSNGQAAKIWTLNFTNYVDTNYVYQIKDTVRFLNAYLEIVNTYVVPLVINNKWENSFLSDSIQVNAQQTFTLYKMNFDNSFLLNELAGGPNYSLKRNEWFCPYIGILTKTRKEFNLGWSDNSYWELSEYKLK